MQQPHWLSSGETPLVHEHQESPSAPHALLLSVCRDTLPHCLFSLAGLHLFRLSLQQCQQASIRETRQARVLYRLAWSVPASRAKGPWIQLPTKEDLGSWEWLRLQHAVQIAHLRSMQAQPHVQGLTC